MYKNKIKFPNKCSFCLLYKLFCFICCIIGGGFYSFDFFLRSKKTSLNLALNIYRLLFHLLIVPFGNQGEMLSVIKFE